MFASTQHAGLIALVACLALSSTHITAAQTEDEDLGTALSSQKNLSKFYGLIKEYPDIVDPSNAAFENIPGTSLYGIWDPKNASMTVPILEYHLLKGIVDTEDLAPGPSIFAATLLTSPTWTNVSAGQNVVDNLLIPPTPLIETLQTFGLDAFFGVLYASDLLGVLQGDEGLAIFAPRDEAFRRVGASLDALGADALRDLVRYHVVRGRGAASATLTNGTRLAAAEGSDVSVRRAGNNLFVNSAQVVQPDILMANGVVHVLDNVLNPRAAAAVPDLDSRGLSCDDSRGGLRGRWAEHGEAHDYGWGERADGESGCFGQGV
ncbi:Fasciclin-like arabinogalactan protein like [Verticillium longisporum]|uniref:Fasciclin-like arabinogalactan protein like n=1 Tax=Verticillium longisporum TaxID=100787 RepID=A0A8I3AIJ3_VERLO|nr:Fasciclin-like arabinogalactan protein like [Verticillium longisporum]